MSRVTPAPLPPVAAKRVTTAAREAFLGGEHQAVVVNSPPGAGKSTFVVATAAALAKQQEQVPVIAQTNAQADDLARSLLAKHPKLEIGRIQGSTGGSELTTGGRLTAATKIDDLEHCNVVVGTAAKWRYIAGSAPAYEAAIIDEAYQMRSDALFYVASLFDRCLFVGDPGQLDPFSPIDDSRWRGYADGPINPAVATVLHNHPEPESAVFKLPVSWRLSARCAPLVSEAFYPQMPFEAGSTEADRALRVKATGADPVDRTITMAAKHGWSFLELPDRVAPPTDREAVATVAALAIRLLVLKAKVSDTANGPKPTPISGDRVAIGVAHRNQRAAVSVELDHQARSAGVDASAVVVDTANRLQGREFDVVVVLHPLSGRAQASEFHLETGRLCVLLSRHRQACIVVGRAGIADVLDTHPGDVPIWIGAPIPVPDGWEANQVVLERLQQFKVVS